MSERKENMMKLLKHGRGIKHILDNAYKILGNPIVMFDLSYNLLANTEINVSDEVLWNEITTLGTFSHETIDFFNTEQFIDAYAKSDVVALMKSKKLKYDRVNGKLFDKDGIQIGDICVTACHKPFDDDDFELIEIICGFVSIELQRSKFYQKIGHVFEETFISKLIDGHNIDKTLVEKKMKDLYLNLKTNLYIAVVDIIHYEHTLTHLVYFRDLFERLQAEFKYFITLNNIIIIISTDNPTLSIKKDLSVLNEFFIKYKIFAGISSSFQNLFELQKYYRQALNALNYSINNNSDEHIFKYDDLMLEHLLNSVKDKIDIWEFFSPVISLIQKYDEENSTVYFDILHTYLLTGMDTQMTSEKMKMDYDALCGQLKMIEEIFGIDWNNGNMLHNIFISIKMLECF